MMQFTRRASFIRGALFFLACCLAQFAADGVEGYGFPALGPIQKGIGGSGVASPQDATWALLNPAGLTKLQLRTDSYTDVFHVELEVEPRGFPLVVNPFAGEMVDEITALAGGGGMVIPFKRLTLGFGMFTYGGALSDFPRPRTTFALIGNGDRRINMGIVKTPLALAHRFENGWSFGAALVPAFTRFRTDSLTVSLKETKGGNEWQYGAGLGMVFGVHKDWERWSVGGSYATATWMLDYNKYEQDLVTSNLDLPQQLQLGIAIRPHAELELTLDYKWIDWTAVKLLGLKTIQGGLGWRDQHLLKAGVSWNVTPKFTLRGGVSAGASAIGKEDILANLQAPALSNLHLSGGLSWQVRPKYQLHMAVMGTPARSGVDNGRGDIFSYLGRGSKGHYEELSVTAGLSMFF